MPSATLTYPAKYLRYGQFRRTSETEQWPSTSELSFSQSAHLVAPVGDSPDVNRPAMRPSTSSRVSTHVLRQQAHSRRLELPDSTTQCYCPHHRSLHAPLSAISSKSTAHEYLSFSCRLRNGDGAGDRRGQHREPGLTRPHPGGGLPQHSWIGCRDTVRSAALTVSDPMLVNLKLVGDGGNLWALPVTAGASTTRRRP